MEGKRKENETKEQNTLQRDRKRQKDNMTKEKGKQKKKLKISIMKYETKRDIQKGSKLILRTWLETESQET